jgi:hypothetical protein
MDGGRSNERRPSNIHRPVFPGSQDEPRATTVNSDFKVPIPRLQRPTPIRASVQSERQRVSHACEPCRRRKSKCDGGQPICSRCKDHQLVCVYADGKREKLRRSVIPRHHRGVWAQKGDTKMEPFWTEREIDVQECKESDDQAHVVREPPDRASPDFGPCKTTDH